MDFDFRLLLAAAGLGLVGYVAWDGWRNRARNNYKFKLEKNLPPDMPERPDREGFSKDGVGKPRLRGHAEAGFRPAVETDFETGFAADDELLSAPRNSQRAEPVEPSFDEAIPANADHRPAAIRGVTPDLFGDDDLGPVRSSPAASRRDSRNERPVRNSTTFLTYTLQALGRYTSITCRACSGVTSTGLSCATASRKCMVSRSIGPAYV